MRSQLIPPDFQELTQNYHTWGGVVGDIVS